MTPPRIDITTLHPVSLRLLLTSMVSDTQGNPLTGTQSEDVLQRLGHIVDAADTRTAAERYGWLPTANDLPVAATQIQAWLDALPTGVRLWLWDGIEYIQAAYGATAKDTP